MAGLALVVGLLAGPLPARADAPWLELDAPREPTSTVEGALIEIRGHGGERRGTGHDLVIAIDVSESTLADAGIDLDGDGPLGRTDPAMLDWLSGQEAGERLVRRFTTQDFEDTVLAAELMAAGALVDRLDPDRFRVALVAFAEDARVLAPLGAPRAQLAEAIGDLRQGFHLERKGTNFSAAVSRSHALLLPPPNVIDGRLRSIVFLTDGAPTRPVKGDRAERYALRSAMEAGIDGIRLFAFAIGPEAEAGLSVMEQMASWTSGRLESVSRPGRIVDRLRRLDLVGLAQMTVRNQTTGHDARALRTFPDGSFDGFVELAPGRNLLHFAARAEDGSLHALERVVHYRAPAVAAGPRNEGSADDEGDPLLEELRRRTAELEAWADAEARRDRAGGQRRELELEVE